MISQAIAYFMRKTLNLLLFILMSGVGLYSQTSLNTMKLYGEVIDDLGNDMVHAHIINISANIGTLTNREGQFLIQVKPEDTVRISSVGYKSKLLLIPFSGEDNLHEIITLEIDTLALSEATIYPFPATLDALRKEFLIVEIEEELPEIELHLDRAGITPEPQRGVVISGPITALYNAFSKHAKIQKKYQALVYDEALRIKSTQIYNADLVKKITGLTTDEETKKFMEFCELEPEFILNSKEYDLYCAIYDCYVEYEKFLKK